MQTTYTATITIREAISRLTNAGYRACTIREDDHEQSVTLIAKGSGETMDVGTVEDGRIEEYRIKQLGAAAE